MILGIFPPQGGSISSLKKAGQDSRFIRSYLGNYAKHFEKVYYFSYANEDPQLPANCYVVKNPGFHRWVYALLLPLIQRRYVQECDFFRVMQMYGAIPAIVAKFLYDKPFIGTYGYRYGANVMAIGGGRLQAVLMEFRAYLGLKFADRVIVTTHRLRGYVEQYVNADKVIIVPNGVDTARFKPERKIAANTGEATVIFVGRFSPEKNLLMLVEALALLPKVTLVLVGEGPLRLQIETLAAQRGVTVEFAGTVPHEQLPELLNAADVFVLLSLSEGHPKVLLEAMSCGLPCVGTNVQGIRDVIQDGQNGLLCELTKDDLASKIALVLSNRELADRLGRRAREFIKENFDLDALLAREIEAMALLADRQGSASLGPGL